MHSNIKPLVIPLALFIFLAGVNVLYAAWTSPSATPPSGNTLAPINVGNAAQVKTGGLSTGALSVVGDQAITDATPSIKFNDSTGGEGDYWTYANGGNFYILNDTDSNGSWETPYPLMLNGPGNFARFENKVRAVSYCDYAGGNCFTPDQVQSSASGPEAINVSGTAQVKTGGLTTGALSVIGNQALSGGSPTIKFNDTTSNAKDYWLHVNGNKFFLLNDNDNSGSWEAPYPMIVDGGANYVQFEDKVRAKQYCDYNGGNCSTAAEISDAVQPPGQSATNGYQWVGGTLMQWGRLSNVSLNQTFHKVNFPTPFPNAIYNVQATVGRSGVITGTVSPVVKSLTKTGVEIAGDHDTNASTGNIFWYAIGR